MLASAEAAASANADGLRQDGVETTASDGYGENSTDAGQTMGETELTDTALQREASAFFKRMHRPEAGRVRLEPLGMQHLDSLADMAFATDLWMYHTRSVVSEEHLIRYIDDGMADRRAMLAYPMAIKDLESDQWAGCCRLEAFNWKDRNVACGHTWLGHGFRQGLLSTDLALALAGFAFEDLGMERVSAQCDARNIRALGRLRQLGIPEEGRVRSHLSNWDGYRRDSVLFGLLRHEWPGMKARWLAH
jgi:RimJ/RimL family protein N-acetyltransferase